MIAIKRVYDPVSSTDGTRLLIERLWPRGVKKTSLKIEGWIKDVAPSAELRQWFSHDPAKWDEFRHRYSAEMKAHPDAWQSIVEAAQRETITLIYSSHDTEHNNAVALQAFSEAPSSEEIAQEAASRTSKSSFEGAIKRCVQFKKGEDMSTATPKWPIFEAKLKSRDLVAERTMAFHFEKPASFVFTPGQFIDIDLLDPPETDGEGNTRGFSVSSAPYEGTIMGLPPRLTQTVKTLFAVRCKFLDRQDHCSAF